MHKKHKYHRAVAWFIISLCFSAANDIITKLLGQEAMSPIHITFSRLFFATITILPYIYTQPKHWHTTNPALHLLRGVIFILASSLWSHGLTQRNITVSMGTVISFTIPLFALLLSALFLREPLTPKLLLYTFIALLGLKVLVYPIQQHLFDHKVIPFLISATLFASLDVINKYSVHKEPIYIMILYSNIIGLCCILPFITQYRLALHAKQIGLLTLLGAGNNAIFFALLKAYQNAPLMSLAPLRYLELPISIVGSIVFFHQRPQQELLASLFIIPAVLCIVYDQQKHTVNNQAA